MLAYDLIVTSLPNFVQQFERRGIRTFYNRLGFAPSVLASVPEIKRDIAVTFVGTLSSHHAERIRLLEYLTARTTLNVWGMGIEEVSEQSPIRGCYRGQAWGREMFAIFRRSQIVINQHIGIAGELRQQHASLRSDRMRSDAGDRSEGQFTRVVRGRFGSCRLRRSCRVPVEN